MKMKRIILSVIVLSLLICAVSCGNSLEKTYPEDLQTEADLECTVILVDADWPYYNTARDVVSASSNVFSGKVTDISFEIIDLVTGKEARDPETSDNTRMLFTVYTVEVKENYKGEAAQTVKIARIGGLKKYNMNEQRILMELSGLMETTANSIPVCGTDAASPAIGNEYLFCTSKQSGDFEYVINPSQFAHATDSSNAKAIIKACGNAAK